MKSTEYLVVFALVLCIAGQALSGEKKKKVITSDTFLLTIIQFDPGNPPGSQQNDAPSTWAFEGFGECIGAGGAGAFLHDQCGGVPVGQANGVLYAIRTASVDQAALIYETKLLLRGYVPSGDINQYGSSAFGKASWGL